MLNNQSMALKIVRGYVVGLAIAAGSPTPIRPTAKLNSSGAGGE